MSPDEFVLTDEQVDNWRKVLVTMPLPPTMQPLGGYALIMPRETVVIVASRVKDLLEVALEQEMEEMFSPSNITRTRPRNSNKPQRSFR